jgi:3-hydroxybutyryl-CoA dehydrogenase
MKAKRSRSSTSAQPPASSELALDADCIAGVVGLGLMGTSIAACLLSSGHAVRGVEPDARRRATARRRVLSLLKASQAQKLLREPPEKILRRFSVSGSFASLAPAEVVIESTVEDPKVKRTVIREIEAVVSSTALIGTNTSAIPVSELQQGALAPERVLGLHWAEPAHITRFMEIICGGKTSAANADRAVQIARAWGKEPSLLRKDIRGFITNRIMYAMLREAFFLVENGYATVADVDRSLRNDLGYWITFAGPFRFMDLTGVPAYAAVMADLLPDLDRSTKVPPLMKQVVASGARGVANAKGFYKYTPAQAKKWEDLFLAFSYEIRALAQKYPEDVGDRARKRAAKH